MNSNTLERINNLLDSVAEEDLEDSIGGGSMQKFAMEAAAASKPHDKAHSPMPLTLDMHNFPNADFYYKLVAKVDGRMFSIYDGKTEYVIGKQLCEPVQSGH